MSVGEQARFDARVRRWRPDLLAQVAALYGDTVDPSAFVDRLLAEAAAAFNARREPLRLLDIERETTPDWFQQHDMIGYVAYADRFGTTLNGVAQRLDHLDELHVKYFHLMKVLRARDGANDGGYAVVDYTDVDPALGTRDDLRALADQLHGRGISLCVDVVMNHTAREHRWAQLARQGSQQHRDYYLVYPDRTDPDRYEETLLEVFPTLAPGNFTWDADLQGWVWTTFNTYQWDLNYANPEVFVEILRVMLELANLGVDVLRLDAVAFTWKRFGTNCQNQPEAHLIAQAYRLLLAIAAPGALLKAEAIVPPRELLPYLGVHHLQRPECQLAYHNQLMVHLWSSLASGDARLATQAMGALAPTPHDASWVNYVRCHDDIGWAVSDEDAHAVGISPTAHRAFLAAFFRGDFDGSYATGASFSSNPDSGDERTCGSAAALAGVSSARAAGDDAALDLAMRRLELLYGVLFGFGGIPLIYMGDEVALDSDLSYLADPSLADDSRWMHRPFMPWSVADRRSTEGTVEHRMFGFMQRLIDARRSAPAMSAGGDTTIHRLPDSALFTWSRQHPRHGRFFAVANFSSRWAYAPTATLEHDGFVQPRLLWANGETSVDGDAIHLGPHSLVWFVDDADGPLQPPT